MATTVRAPFIPTICSICPEMPQAMYRFGLTVWPDNPMRLSTGSQSTSPVNGRDPASVPPSRRASCSSCFRSSMAFTPRPAETMTSALEMSTWLRARGLTLNVLISRRGKLHVQFSDAPMRL